MQHDTCHLEIPQNEIYSTKCATPNVPRRVDRMVNRSCVNITDNANMQTRKHADITTLCIDAIGTFYKVWLNNLIINSLII